MHIVLCRVADRHRDSQLTNQLLLDGVLHDGLVEEQYPDRGTADDGGRATPPAWASEDYRRDGSGDEQD